MKNQGVEAVSNFDEVPCLKLLSHFSYKLDSLPATMKKNKIPNWLYQLNIW